MKKIALPLVLLSVLAAVPAYADDTKTTPVNDEAIKLDSSSDHSALCREAISLQEKRIRDLRAAVEYDKGLERQLIDGARVREEDAKVKDDHAARWRRASDAVSDASKKRAFAAFATWLEGEARTDRNFATERRDAARIIGKGWAQAASAISGHEKYLADLKANCNG